MGIAPSQVFLNKVNNIVRQFDFIRSIYDLTIHDYGFGRFVVSMRIAGCFKDREALHTIADDISYQVYKQLNCRCTVQTDYYYDDTSEIERVFQQIEQFISKTDPNICLQNFRLTKTESHINLILDLIMPSALQSTGESVKDKIIKMYPEYRTICNIIILHNHPMPLKI